MDCIKNCNAFIWGEKNYSPTGGRGFRREKDVKHNTLCCRHKYVTLQLRNNIPQMTKECVKKWHLCPEWDNRLIHYLSEEAKLCSCSKE